jgi:hypothetical protein
MVGLDRQRAPIESLGFRQSSGLVVAETVPQKLGGAWNRGCRGRRPSEFGLDSPLLAIHRRNVNRDPKVVNSRTSRAAPGRFRGWRRSASDATSGFSDALIRLGRLQRRGKGAPRDPKATLEGRLRRRGTVVVLAGMIDVRSKRWSGFRQGRVAALK